MQMKNSIITLTILLILLFNSLSAKAENSKEWINNGESYIDQGDYKKALECFTKVLEIDPKNKYAQFWKECCQGFIFHSQEKYIEAIKCYDNSLDVCPELGPWYFKGNALYLLGKYEDAIYCYNKELEKYPDDIANLSEKGCCLCALGNYKEGIKCFDKVLKLDPGNNTARQNKELAIKDLNKESPKVIAQSQTADELGNEGTVLTNLGKYEEAVKCLNAALHSNPDSADLWLNRGICYFNLKDYKKALESFSKYTKLTNIDLRTIDKSEKMAEIYYGMGLCNYNLRNIKGAAENFKTSAQCYEYAETYEALAVCYNEMGKPDLAQEALRERDILIQNQKIACDLLTRTFNFVLKFGEALNKDIMK